MNLSHKTAIFAIPLALAFGCASVREAPLQSSNPKLAMQEIKSMQKELISSNSDILGHTNYEAGSKKLSSAEAGLKSDESYNEVMKELAQAKTHFINAKTTAASRNEIPHRVFEARQNAIKAEVAQSRQLREKMDTVDEDLRDDSKQFAESLSVKQMSSFQNRYLGLEIEAVQNAKLGVFRRIIKDAQNSNAAKLAPKAYKEAQSDLSISENLIKQSPRESSQYSQSIDKTNRSAKLLQDVMSKLLNEAKGSSETVATKLVMQERSLGQLTDRVDSLQVSLGASTTALGSMTKEAASQKSQKLSAENKLRFQTAMDRVRKDFNKNEAAVYQQGDELIIRLTEIDFKSGKSTIPTKSMALLSKISHIIGDLEPTEIVIEGHTDSVGKRYQNMMLSNERADAVKNYFSSLDVGYQLSSKGYGETKPIANNETSDGRLLNRRVDIVVKARQ